jgi:hypothetical protein
MIRHNDGWRLFIDDGYWRSLVAPPSAAVTYRLGEWTKPHHRCGPLTVFVTQFATRSFAEEFLGLYGSVMAAMYRPRCRMAPVRWIRSPYCRLWAPGGEQRGAYPEGTLFAAAIMRLGDGFIVEAN